MRQELNSTMATVPTERTTDEVDHVRWLMQMQANLAETLHGVMLRGARPVQIGQASGATSLVSTSAGRFVGWSVRESTGANPAVLRLWDGRNNEGHLLACINLSNGGSNTTWLSPGGVSFQYGLYVEIISGTGLSDDVEGAVYLGAAE